MAKTTYQTVDEYIDAVPKNTRRLLEKIRIAIRKTVPGVEEVISYQMPAFKLNGKIVVYYAAWKNHIGFYALPSGTAAFKKELSKYKFAKGSIQFPINEPLPMKLILKIIKFRVKENLEKEKKKSK